MALWCSEPRPFPTFPLMIPFTTLPRLLNRLPFELALLVSISITELLELQGSTLKRHSQPQPLGGVIEPPGKPCCFGMLWVLGPCPPHQSVRRKARTPSLLMRSSDAVGDLWCSPTCRHNSEPPLWLLGNCYQLPFFRFFFSVLSGVQTWLFQIWSTWKMAWREPNALQRRCTPAKIATSAADAPADQWPPSQMCIPRRCWGCSW